MKPAEESKEDSAMERLVREFPTFSGDGSGTLNDGHYPPPPGFTGRPGGNGNIDDYSATGRMHAIALRHDDDGEEDIPLAKRSAAPVVTQPRPSSPRKKPAAKIIISDDEDSSSSEDVPLSMRAKPSAAPNGNRSLSLNKTAVMMQNKHMEDSSSSEEDVPLAQRTSTKPAAGKSTTAKRKSIASNSDESSEEDVPLAKRTMSPAVKQKKVAATKKKSVDSDSDSDIPLAKKTAKPVAKVVVKKPAQKPAAKKSRTEKGATITAQSPKKKSKKDALADQEDKEEGEEDEEEFRWWEQDLDDSVKWNTLQHNGVLFPPDYEPHGVKMKYDGREVTLSPASEEVAGFFAQLIGTQYVENETFCKNFFADFRKVLKRNDPDCPIREYSKCDFTPMTEYFLQQRELKKNMSKEEKLAIKEEKKQLEEKYGYAMIDGRKEKVGNFRIEPPGLFRGRGDHPKTGTLKLRVMPEQVTINIGKDAQVPPPPPGHKWGGVVHDNTVAWLATWTENVNNNIKYVLFAAGSSLKGMSDLKKFEKARELKKHIDRIRRDYTAELKDKLMMVRQRATTMWLIDKLALRAGNEKGEDEADTVGCCSLRYEHVQLEEDVETAPDPDHPGQTKTIVKKMVVFDFLGKDSIRYYNRVEVDPIVWKNLKIFKKEPKKEGDPLFDRLTTQLLNKHLQSLMPGLTAKVFRTYNASHTFQEELKKPMGTTVAEKVLAYNRANRQVAILCNHQRTVSKAHGAQMERITDKILSLKYERHLVKEKILKLEPKLKKKRPELAEPESDMDEDTLAEKKQEYHEKELEKLEKKYEKMCEKAKEEGQPKPAKPKLSDLAQREPNMERLEKQLVSLNGRIEQAKLNRVDKDENKTTALGTSKINYIDPRITAAWCSKHEVPVEKMFNRSLREKFKWAMTVDADWQF